jgi:hypothetical protein
MTDLFHVPREFRENNALSMLGDLQLALSTAPSTGLCINFHQTAWSDPLPLMLVALSVVQYVAKGARITVDLGNFGHGTPEHRTFLKFIASQGFLDCLATRAELLCDGKATTDTRTLREQLSGTPHLLKYRNADCIHARILDLSCLLPGAPEFDDTVEAIVRQAMDRANNSAFGGDARVRDIVFQKLRKLVYELFLNILEHAYRQTSPKWAGIYARIRSARPSDPRDAADWDALLAKDCATYGQRQFEPNPAGDWLEIFVADVGCGLTSRIGDWTAPDGRDDLAQIIRKARSSRYPLEILAPRLFCEPFSCVPRHDSERSSITGLQDLGHVLGLGADYARVYSDFGTWIGGRFPWALERHGSRKNILRARDPLHSVPAAGTGYVCSIQPAHRSLLFDTSVWRRATAETRSAILRELTVNLLPEPPGRTLWLDMREDTAFREKIPEVGQEDRIDTLIIRPPRLMTKQDAARWTHWVAGDLRCKPTRPVTQLVLGELTPFQALALFEFFSKVRVNHDSATEVVLVAEGWLAAGLRTSKGSAVFTCCYAAAHEFLDNRLNSSRVRASDLALILRQSDSELFWRSAEAMAFFDDAPIQWTPDGDTPEIVLDRYLDLVQALSVPACYRSAKRALRRIFDLTPDLEPIAADDLVRTLVEDTSRSSYEYVDDTRNHRIRKLLVGSVSVTMDLTRRFETRSDLSIGRIAHLLVHQENSSRVSQAALAALLWVSDLSDEIAPLQPATHPTRRWRRIANTPFVAEHGDKSLSILRYPPAPSGALDFSRSYYGQTPTEMYRDFARYDVLRLGHWAHGARHDLLTINVRQAYEFAFLEHGRMKTWMVNKFRECFVSGPPERGPNASVLVYPSHATNDAIMARISDDADFKAVLPVGGILPVKFVGKKTVSPFLFSPTVKIELIRRKKLPGKHWAAVVFDDGTVTGKHVRELKEYILTAGASHVYTIVILDRSGHPAHEGVVQRDQVFNPRFWRWDVPPLGYQRGCVLCSALSVVRTLSARLSSATKSQRLRQIVEEWRARKVNNEWYSPSLRPKSVAPPISVTFGIDPKVSGVSQNRIVVDNSASLASLCVELTRLTTRKDVALSKAVFLRQDNPVVAIETVAAQLLIFMDELNYWERLERYCFLIDTTWKLWPENSSTGLVVLLFAVVDDELREGVADYVKRCLLDSEVALSVDAILCLHVLLSPAQLDRLLKTMSQEPCTDILSRNALLLGTGDVRATFQRLLTLVAGPSSTGAWSAHPSRLRKLLLRSGEVGEMPQDTRVALLQDLSRELRSLDEVVEALARNRVFAVGADWGTVSSQLRRCVGLLTAEAASKLDTLSSELRSSLEDVNGAIFGAKSGIGYLSTLFGQISKQLLPSNLVASLLDGEIDDVRESWPSIVHAKAELPGLRHWSEVVPRIRCGVQTKWNKGYVVLWNDIVSTVIRDLLVNVVYSVEDINNPWASAGSKAAMWWNVSPDERKQVLALVFENATKSIGFSLKYTEAIAGLERLGGRVSAPEFFEGPRVRLRVEIPLFTFFSNGGDR